MRYHNITKDDMLNGDGLRVVLWVAGCNHCCRDCQNPITWDPNGGLAFTEAEEAEIFLEGASICTLGEGIVTHGTVTELYKDCGLDTEALYKKAVTLVRGAK